MPLFSKRLKTQTVAPEKLIVGLGNPGPGYGGNRHNVGFMALTSLAKKHQIRLDKKRGQARIGEGSIGGVPVLLARPQTYMNISGDAVKDLLGRLKVSPAALIVVHDDLDLPLGRIRVRQGGSAGGHNGIKSIIAQVGTPEFVRVRVGIGRPTRADGAEDRERDVISYVLTDFSREERAVIEAALPRVGQAIECLVENGLTEAMNRFNSIAAEDKAAKLPEGTQGSSAMPGDDGRVV